MRFVHPYIHKLGGLPFGLRFTSDGLIAFVPLQNSFQTIDCNKNSVVKYAFLQNKCSFWKDSEQEAREFSYGELLCLEDEPLVAEWLKTSNVL